MVSQRINTIKEQFDLVVYTNLKIRGKYMIIYKLKNRLEEVVGNIDVKEDKIIVSNKNFINEFTNMHEALLYTVGNKLDLIPMKDSE